MGRFEVMVKLREAPTSGLLGNMDVHEDDAEYCDDGVDPADLGIFALED